MVHDFYWNTSANNPDHSVSREDADGMRSQTQFGENTNFRALRSDVHDKRLVYLKKQKEFCLVVTKLHQISLEASYDCVF